MKNLGFNLYLLFMVSWFLHFGARIPVLGMIRFDLVLVLILGPLAFSKRTLERAPRTRTDKLLVLLIAYSIVTVPFVQWPGSVIQFGLPNLIKAVVFYYFTVAFVDDADKLRRFIAVFVICQSLRILEPLYLHVTTGYWGSSASMANWEMLDRLSGAPSDVVNPNGLAFIVCTVLPFLYFHRGMSKARILSVLLAPLFVYALALTGSRSGLVAFGAILLAILIKSKRAVFVGVLFVVVIGLGFSLLPGDLQDRYLSTFGRGEKNAATADDRLEAMNAQWQVALRRPLLGHGLGTSAEANSHFSQGPYAGIDLPAHNLYLEIAQELGIVGLIIFLLLMQSIIRGFVESQRVIRKPGADASLLAYIDAMQVWLAMNCVFSFASYGLTSYEWYLFAGLSVVMQRFAKGLNPDLRSSRGLADKALAYGKVS